jgi:hypothetical protein
LAPRCIMQRRDVTPAASCSWESNFNLNNLLNLKANLRKRGSKVGTFAEKRTEAENLVLLSL